MTPPAHHDSTVGHAGPDHRGSLHRLGYASLLPFVLLTLLAWLVSPDLVPFVASALAGYAATMAALLGGVHWGIGMQQGAHAQHIHFTWGLMPALGAWVAVMMPPYAGLPLLGLLLVACYLVDRKTWHSPGLRMWLTLRFRQTVISVLCCLLGAATA